jgi:glutamate---cysteine ligase / carboxylate-amine ligase
VRDRPSTRDRRRAPRLPAWAHWSEAGADRPWTIGVEEEAVLLDPRSWCVANRIDDVLAALPPAVAAQAAAETHACVVELRTVPHATAAGAAAELARLRRALHGTLRDRLGLRAAAAGTHPLATRSEVAVSSTARYREVRATMRALAHREPTMALHVHVAVPDGATAVRALDGLRCDLPLVLALSANSPYWRGDDSGFASIRTPIFSMFPRVGIPRSFGTYPAYVRALDALLRSGAIAQPGFVWWDARLQPRLGTVEVRIADAQTRVIDTAAVAALVHCLVRRHADLRRSGSSSELPEVLAENRFLAARDGVDADLIEGSTGRRRPLRDALAEVLDACRPFAGELGCTAELAAAAVLTDDPAHARQRRLAARAGLARLPGLLCEEFAPVRPVALAA